MKINTVNTGFNKEFELLVPTTNRSDEEASAYHAENLLDFQSLTF